MKEIHSYISSREKSTRPADKFIHKIIEKTGILITHPYVGQEEQNLRKIGQNSRYLVVANYKIIYQIDNNNVIITDVLHTKQNPEKLTKRE